MERVRNFSVLLLILVLLAEFEDFTGRVVVELEELVVGSEGIQDVLERVDEEVDPGDNFALLFEGVQMRVGHQEIVISSHLKFVDHGHSLVLFSEETLELFLAEFCLQLQVDLLTLISEVLEHLLEEQ